MKHRGTLDSVMMGRAIALAAMSKDPSTKIGCIIERDSRQISEGYNGFPQGVYDDPKKLNDRSKKMLSICHAEANAVAWAARSGASLLGSTAYVTAPCCAQCAALLIQAGVSRVVIPAGAELRPDWKDSVDEGQSMFAEAEVVQDSI